PNHTASTAPTSTSRSTTGGAVRSPQQARRDDDEALQSFPGAEPAPSAHLHGREGHQPADGGGRPDGRQEPDAGVSGEEPVGRAAGAGARRRRLHRRIGGDLPLSRRAAPRTQSDGPQPTRAGRDRDVEPAHGARAVRVDRPDHPQHPPDVQGTAAAIPRIRRDAARRRAAAAGADGDRGGGGWERGWAGGRFAAGDGSTLSDLPARVAIDIAGRRGTTTTPPALANLNRWHQAVSSRPSAKA